MLETLDIQKVLSIKDDRSGDHAQDGFDFQASSAIYLMFREIDNNQKFFFIYEKLDDFIIFVDDIRLYQAKSTSKNLSDTILFQKEEVKQKSKRKKKTDLDHDVENEEPLVNLSIIEKMQNNLNLVNKELPKKKVMAYLIWNKDYRFGAGLLKGTKLENSIENLNLDNISKDVKEKIIQKTTLDSYDWEKIEIIRLLSKQHYESITSQYIEDVIYRKIGENQSYSKAFFNAMLSKVRHSRINKKLIDSDEILQEIQKLKNEKACPQPEQYQHLLTELDFRNRLIHTSVKEVFSLISLRTSSIKTYYKELQVYIKNHINEIIYPCSLCEKLKGLSQFDTLFLVHSDEKVKAMIINIFIEMEDR